MKKTSWMKAILVWISLHASFLTSAAWAAKETEEPVKGNMVMFVGVDISGSYKNTPYYEDSIKFLAYYLYGHLHAIEGLEPLNSLFVGSIGGAKPDEPKTFHPIQTFAYKNVEEIEAELHKIFPKKITNKFTDYNAFFKQVTEFAKNKKVVMKPITVVMLSDGIPDAPKVNGKHDYRYFDLKPMENLSRNVTIRLLYTSAVVGSDWQNKVPRKRIKIWTQDAVVMAGWKAPDIMLAGKPFTEQKRFFSWVKDNVDFPIGVKRID